MTLPSDSHPISQAGTQAAAAKTCSQETPSPEQCALRRQPLSQKEERILSAINRAARIGEVSAFAFPLFGKISGVGVGNRRDGRALAAAIAMRKQGIPLPGCPVVEVELLAFP